MGEKSKTRLECGTCYYTPLVFSDIFFIHVCLLYAIFLFTKNAGIAIASLFRANNTFHGDQQCCNVRDVIDSLCLYKNLCVNSLDFPNITNHIACYWFVCVILTSFLRISQLCPNSLLTLKHLMNVLLIHSTYSIGDLEYILITL